MNTGICVTRYNPYKLPLPIYNHHPCSTITIPPLPLPDSGNTVSEGKGNAGN